MVKMIVDLCGGSGSWSKPYVDSGYTVILVDPTPWWNYHYSKVIPSNLGWIPDLTVEEFRDSLGANTFEYPYGILAAPPCTHFSLSGAQYWKEKDADGRTEEHLKIVDACLDIIDIIKPEWWVLENPVGRLSRLRPDRLGKPRMYIQPYEYGDPWTKKTCLWGNFTEPEKNIVEPIRFTKQGSWTQKYGGSSLNTKRNRSVTAPGFAQAFKEANP